MQFSFNVLLGLLGTISFASAASFDLHYVPPRDGMSAEERHAAVADHLSKRIASGVYAGLGNETGVDKRSRTASMDLGSNSNGDVWAVKARFGSNEVEQTMILDSGYAHTLIAKNSGYNPDDSDTVKKTGEDVNANFSTGAGNEGTILRDDVSVGGLTAKALAFGYTDSHDFSSDDNLNGVLGIALPNHYESALAFLWHGWHGIVSVLKHQGVTDEAKYQVTLKKDGGKFSIGEVDDSLYEGELKSVWNLGRFRGMCGFKGSVNGKTRGFVIDTGSPGMMALDSEMRRFLESLDGVETSTNSKTGTVTGKFNCDSPPKVKINVDGKLDVEIPEDVLTMYDVGDGKCMLPFYGFKNVGVFFKFNWLIGAPFLRQVSYVCDFDSNHMQIAKQASN